MRGTRNGVYYDLTKSPYKIKVGNVEYVFSSKTHQDKFKSRLESNRENINNSLSSRFKMDIKVNTLADLSLYKKVETRGFYIISEVGEKICKNNLLYAGEKVTNKNSTKQ